MESSTEYDSRLELARKYVEEAEWTFSSKRWRLACASSQLAVQNACKAVYALYRSVPKVHDMSDSMVGFINWGAIPDEQLPAAERLARLSDLLGAKEKMMILYGDEVGAKNPWEIADEGRAQRSLAWAREAMSLAENYQR